MLKSLTSFRFIAALMVYLTHSVGFFGSYQFGAIGVSFFFVLSGFILSYNYHSKFTELNKATIKKFYIARLAKVYPVCILTLCMSIPYVFFVYRVPISSDFFSGMIANIFMVQSFIPLPFSSTPYLFNLVSWSLSDEIFFYVMFPFIIYLFLKLKVNIRMAILVFIGIIGVATLSTLFREVKVDDWYYYVFPVFRSLDFIMGILMGLMFVTNSRNRTIVNKSLLNVLEVFALVLFIAWIVFSPQVNQVFRFSIYFIPMWCFLIYIFAFQGGFITRILSHKWLVFLGEISFSFYMVHLLVINYVGLIPMGSLVNHVITLFGSILLSAVIYLIYEEPLRKRIRFGAKKKEKIQQEPAAAIIKA